MPTTSLNSIELPAKDLASTKEFYESNFGWAFADFGPTYASARVSGIEVGFNGDATVGTLQADGEQNPTGPLLLLETNDLDAIYSTLRSYGSTIVTSPFDFPGGRRLHFRDPSGNVLGVYQPVEFEVRR